MKIFVSWSNPLAERIAGVVADWIPLIFPTADVWISSRGISAGQRSMSQIEEGLKDAQFGIICVTPANQNATWLNFEAGAISNALGGTARVAPMLTGFTSKAALSGPLSLFQASLTDRAGFSSLAESINETLASGARTPAQLSQVLDALWPTLDSLLQPLREEASTAAAKPGTEAPQERGESEMIEEILLLVRDIKRLEELPDLDRKMARRLNSGSTLASKARTANSIPRIGSDFVRQDLFSIAGKFLGEERVHGFAVQDSEQGQSVVIKTYTLIKTDKKDALSSYLIDTFDRIYEVKFELVPRTPAGSSSD